MSRGECSNKLTDCDFALTKCVETVDAKNAVIASCKSALVNQITYTAGTKVQLNDLQAESVKWYHNPFALIMLGIFVGSTVTYVSTK